VAESLADSPAVGHRRTRARKGRVRAHVIRNLINYAVWSSYLGIGIAVSVSNGYLDHLSRFTSIVPAAGAVLLWPLVFIE
jgi:hypothetical protein